MWSPNQLHIERVEADEQLIETAVPRHSGDYASFRSCWENGIHVHKRSKPFLKVRKIVVLGAIVMKKKEEK